MAEEIINAAFINEVLEKTANPDPQAVRDVLQKARGKKGLELGEAGLLVNLKDPGLREELFEIAHAVKDEIYGERLVFFAPLYVSDFCVNDCIYCNFHQRNRELRHKKLSLEEVEEEARILIGMGHKRILLEFGEDPVHNPIDYILEIIERIYSVKTDKGNIRRLNVNIAATTVENYRKLKGAQIGTYQLFQETYHRPTYEKVHRGPKADYERQITSHNRALAGGLEDVGLGVLFGLYDWRFEVLALVSHARYLDQTFGVGPHTISVPRFRPAPSVDYEPACRVSDEDFLKLIAILRVSVPYTGMIITTRERPEIRKAACQIGISQTSAGSVTVTGGYSHKYSQPQFEISDSRSLEAVIKDVLGHNLLPSFCTACYRLGRTGKDFMALSKPGQIQKFCRPNALLTLAEYLEDFAANSLYEKARLVIDFYLKKIDNESLRQETERRLLRIKQGERDLYF